MRISAQLDHPDYNPYSTYANVTLDNVPLYDCMLADEEKGEVERIDYLGSTMDTLKTILHKGKVVISFDNLPEGVDVNDYFINRAPKDAK